jgi:hypothetical protein
MFVSDGDGSEIAPQAKAEQLFKLRAAKGTGSAGNLLRKQKLD